MMALKHFRPTEFAISRAHALPRRDGSTPQRIKEGKIDAFARDTSLPGKAIVDLTPSIKIRASFLRRAGAADGCNA